MPASTRPNKPRRILIVDDDAFTRDMLRQYLSTAGMEVKTAEHANAMNSLIRREQFDLILLDVMMPGEDGLSVCRRIRGGGDRTPIIMLTGKSDEVDRIVGLEMGVDDYVSKPFNPRELLARMAAVLRRAPVLEHPADPEDDAEPIRFGRFVLDLGARVLFKDEERIPLTTGEFALLKAFVTHPKQALSREKLAPLAQGRDYEIHDRSLDVKVARLRKLIEIDPRAPRHIQTVWGMGYVFIPEG